MEIKVDEDGCLEFGDAEMEKILKGDSLITRMYEITESNTFCLPADEDLPFNVKDLVEAMNFWLHGKPPETRGIDTLLKFLNVRVFIGDDRIGLSIAMKLGQILDTYGPEVMPVVLASMSPYLTRIMVEGFGFSRIERKHLREPPREFTTRVLSKTIIGGISVIPNEIVEHVELVLENLPGLVNYPILMRLYDIKIYRSLFLNDKNGMEFVARATRGWPRSFYEQLYMRRENALEELEKTPDSELPSLLIKHTFSNNGYMRIRREYFSDPLPIEEQNISLSGDEPFTEDDLISVISGVKRDILTSLNVSLYLKNPSIARTLFAEEPQRTGASWIAIAACSDEILSEWVATEIGYLKKEDLKKPPWELVKKVIYEAPISILKIPIGRTVWRLLRHYEGSVTLQDIYALIDCKKFEEFATKQSTPKIDAAIVFLTSVRAFSGSQETLRKVLERTTGSAPEDRITIDSLKTHLITQKFSLPGMIIAFYELQNDPNIKQAMVRISRKE